MIFHDLREESEFDPSKHIEKILGTWKEEIILLPVGSLVRSVPTIAIQKQQKSISVLRAVGLCAP